jgi:pyruvate dehydrogenase E2 component (dihydrolipoamide acetyltransferase)
LLEHKQKSITVWLLFIVSKVMMLHEAFRSKLMEDALVVMPNASISLAVADAKDLYMPVITDVNTLSIDEIEEKLQTFKIKLQKRNFTQDDMRGSTFGISNLGMLGVERFDAMINSDDAAILAVGAVVDGKISLTLTVDHRIINGYEAALFMADLKRELQNSLNFKGV